MLIMLLFAVNAALLGWRRDVVRIMPQTASLYAAIGLPVNLRGLAFTRWRHQGIHDGVPVLLCRARSPMSAASRSTCRAFASHAQRRRRRGLFLDHAAGPPDPCARRRPAVPEPARIAAGGRTRGGWWLLHPPRCRRGSH